MISRFRFLPVYALIVATWAFVQFHEPNRVPANPALSSFPVDHAGWRMVDSQEFDQAVLNKLRPTDYMQRTYAGPDGEVVSLYIGYHDGVDSGAIHSPRNCLPGSGWTPVLSGTMGLDAAEGRPEVVRAVYGRDNDLLLFLYWYQVRGRVLASDYSLKLAEVSNALLHGRKDSAFVRVSVRAGEAVQAAESVALRFAGDFYPLIREALPR